MTYMLQEILASPDILASLEKENRHVLTALGAELRQKQIRSVTFAGRGTSDHASIYGQYLLSIIGGVCAGLAIPSAISLYGSQIDYGESLVIAVSQSGSAADALAVLECARQSGAVTLAITNDPQSPLAKAAQWHLFCHADEEKSVAATKTFTSQLALLYLLAAYWFEREDMKQYFAQLPRKLNAWLSEAVPQMESFVRPYRYMEDGFILSRGITYPIALETMLKVQETCYVKLKAYSSADFYHGPLAQVDRRTPVIVYAPSGAALQENLAMAEKIRSLGNEPLVVTDSEQVFQQASSAFLLPKAEDELAAPLFFAVFAQLFAQALCLERGGDPDHPRNLKKVTVTR
ncbi:MAG: SIS domain-containing protein [Clostridia bacterium]|nr:SIS domain-containing protein [Clostridia bacterium]